PDALDARGAESALVAADARVERVRGQGLAAVLAGRPELKHRAHHRSFGDGDARAAHFLRVVLELRQTIVHRELRLLVVDVHPGAERKLGDHGGIDVGNSPARVLGEEMPAALLAPLAIAPRRLVVGADALGPARDPQRFGLPEREGVDRSRRPGAAGFAVAIAHRRGRARDGEVDGAAEAAPFVGGSMLRALGGAGFGCSRHDRILWLALAGASLPAALARVLAEAPRLLTATPWMPCRTF